MPKVSIHNPKTMSTKIFIPDSISIQEIKAIIDQVEKTNPEANNIIVGQNIDNVINTLQKGDTIVVNSLNFFPSLIDLLTTLSELQERGITLTSITEPWLNQEISSTADFLEKLRALAIVLHQNRTLLGIRKARAAGKQLGRPVGSCKTR